jgi:hypothetical protein
MYRVLALVQHMPRQCDCLGVMVDDLDAETRFIPSQSVTFSEQDGAVLGAAFGHRRWRCRESRRARSRFLAFVQHAPGHYDCLGVIVDDLDAEAVSIPAQSIPLGERDGRIGSMINAERHCRALA